MDFIITDNNNGDANLTLALSSTVDSLWCLRWLWRPWCPRCITSPWCLWCLKWLSSLSYLWCLRRSGDCVAMLPKVPTWCCLWCLKLPLVSKAGTMLKMPIAAYGVWFLSCSRCLQFLKYLWCLRGCDASGVYKWHSSWKGLLCIHVKTESSYHFPYGKICIAMLSFVEAQNVQGRACTVTTLILIYNCIFI